MTDIVLKNRKLNLKKEYAITRSRTDFYYFLRYMFPNKSVTWSWHHEYVCSVLQDFANGFIKNLMIFMPPQHQKSTMMTIYLPAFMFGVNPNDQIQLLAYSETLASKFNRSIQRVIDTDLYTQIFPETKLNSKRVSTDSRGAFLRNSNEFEIVGHHGFLKSVGVGGGIAGVPAKKALLDDIIKNHAEANSKTYRNRVYDWYTDELEARLHNDSQVAFTITRRHEDDLAGRLLERDGIVSEGGKWDVLSLPALKENDDDPHDPRNIGDALFPELHSKERMEEIRDKNPRTFISLYQQRPAPLDGAIIMRDWFNWYEKGQINKLTPYFYIDPAYTDKQENDPTAIMAFVPKDNSIYITNVTTVRFNFPDLIEFIISYVKQNFYNSKSRIFIEPKASGLSIYQELKANTGLNVVKDKPPKDSKITRVHAETPFLESGRAYLPMNEAWTKPFLDECSAFPNGANDDQVDCLTASCRIVRLSQRRNLKTYTA